MPSLKVVVEAVVVDVVEDVAEEVVVVIMVFEAEVDVVAKVDEEEEEEIGTNLMIPHPPGRLKTRIILLKTGMLFQMIKRIVFVTFVPRCTKVLILMTRREMLMPLQLLAEPLLPEEYQKSQARSVSTTDQSLVPKEGPEMLSHLEEEVETQGPE